MNAVSAGTVLNICLSSCHCPNISTKRGLKLVVEDREEHHQDIAIYVHHKLRMRDRDIEEQLLQTAAGIFMWIILVVNMLNQAFDEGKVRAMQRKLREVPSDLDDVFQTLLKEDNPDKQETTLMLQWVLFAGRPLRPEELYLAMLAGTEKGELGAWNQSGDTSKNIKQFITTISKGLIEVCEGRINTVQFIHKSVNDFLLRNKGLQTLDPALKLNVIGTSHDRLRACCMSYIMIKQLKPFDKNRSHLSELTSNYPFLEYASAYVLHHAEEAQRERIMQQALVQWLQQPHEFERLTSFHDAFRGEDDLSNSLGEELLYAASLYGHYELVLFVLELGADINKKGGYYGHALQVASAKGYDHIVQRLLEKGADVNARGGYYGHALQVASAKGYDHIVQRLLEKGADVNARGGYYRNALHSASHWGRDRIVQRLLENGADVNAKGGYHDNALQAASVLGYDYIVQLLLENGADANIQGGPYGNTLQAASAWGYDQIVQQLLEKGADANMQGGHYGNALQAASAHGHNQIVQQLLENGADVNAQGGQYGNALQAA